MRRIGSLLPESLVAAIEYPQDASKSGESSLGARQRGDQELLEIFEYLEQRKLPEDEKRAKELALTGQQYVILDKVLYYVSRDDTLRIIPPHSDRRSLFDEVHGGPFGGHLRDAKIHGELNKRYWWKGMRSDVIRWCQSCLVCASRHVGQAVRAPLTPIPVAGPFDRVGVDVLKLPKSSSGNQYAVVFVDYLTKWPEVFATKDQTALTIAKLFVEEVVSRHGVPSQLLSDRGQAFLSKLMGEVCEVLGVRKVNTTSYHPQTDGLVERFNRTLTNMLSKRVDRDGTDWDLHLPYTLFAYRASIQESTLESPFFLLHGRDPRLPSALDMDPPCPREVLCLDSYKEELVSTISDAWDLARESVKKAQKAQKRVYDKRSRELNLKAGERVFVYMPKEKASKAYKFARPFHGPFRVMDVLETGVIVQPVDRPQDGSIRVAFDRVRRCPTRVPEGVSWPPKRPSRKRKNSCSRSSQDPVPKEKEVPPPLWAGRLRGHRRNKSSEDALRKSGDV